MLAYLMPGNAVFAQQPGDRTVALVGPGVAGLLVRPQRIDPVRADQPAQHVQRLAVADDQWLTKHRQLLAQGNQILAHERPLPSRRVGLLPQPGFDDVQRQDRAVLRGARQGLVILDAQISLEPDDLQHDSGGGAPAPKQGCRRDLWPVAAGRALRRSGCHRGIPAVPRPGDFSADLLGAESWRGEQVSSLHWRRRRQRAKCVYARSISGSRCSARIARLTWR